MRWLACNAARMRKDGPLSVRQVQVLQWVNDGCPDGVWRDYTYKTTAYALAARGLISVDRRRGRWSAQITEDGSFYLAHGRYPSDTRSPVARSDRAETGSALDDLAEKVLAELTSGDGTLTVASPSERERAQYRRVIHRLITGRQIPEGLVLRHTGRDHGDLTIRLIGESEEAHPEPAPEVVVPSTMSAVTNEVRTLAAETQMALTEASMDRALRILQAIANECAKRGWTLEREPTDDRRFRVNTNECHFELALSEELVDREVADEEQLSAAKYPWQRIPLKQRKVGSGRLTLLLGQYWQRKSWSDRRRWTLDDKLGAVFVELERRVAEAAQQRQLRQDDLRRRQRAWDAAMIEAQQAYVISLNRRRMREQVTNHIDAQAFRDYADTLSTAAERCTEPAEADSIRRWRQFAMNEAARIDPISTSDALHNLEPDTVRPEDCEPFLPKGMSAHRRPTQ